MTHNTPPKRIWAFPWNGQTQSGQWHTNAADHSREYTLTSEAEAMVAAALREAAEGLLDWYTNVEDDRGPHMVVRALIPQPASAALDKLIAVAVKAERERSILIAASLAAAISLLERGGKAAKKAAPSDKMFDQMLDDYRTSLEAWRAAKGDTT